MIPFLVALGCSESVSHTGADTAPAPDTAPEFDATYDVVVVGSGPAGSAAVLAATEAGASVVLFERETTLGEGVRMASQAYGVLTPWQEEAGIEDSLALAQADWTTLTGVDGARASVTAYMSGTSDVLVWLSGHGVDIHGPNNASGEGSVARIHEFRWPGEGTSFEQLMGDTAYTARTGVEVTGPVIVDGAVVGVEWRDVASGETGATGARGGVVVATGGFLRNREAVAEVRPDLAELDPIFETLKSSTGGGLPFFEAIGAGREEPANIGTYVHSVPDPRDPETEAMILMTTPSYLLVGSDGQRFTAGGGFGSFEVIDLLPAGGAWLVAGVDDAESMVFSPPAYNWANQDAGPELYSLPALQALGSEDLVVDADLATAAVVAGVDPAVADVIDAYNDLAATSQTDEFGVPLDPTDQLRGTSWAFVHFRPALAKNFGGVLTDLSSRVLTPDGTPIPGVWAAGECVGMVPGGGSGRGFSGSASALYYGGRLAGLGAAERSLSAP